MVYRQFAWYYVEGGKCELGPMKTSCSQFPEEYYIRIRNSRRELNKEEKDVLLMR